MAKGLARVETTIMLETSSRKQVDRSQKTRGRSRSGGSAQFSFQNRLRNPARSQSKWRFRPGFPPNLI
eukprot:8979256-Pyramimonas_sp.AAC.1